ncbi:hypothetical protein ABEB36_013996 [Hypothenemus hampei]|uniref:Uncharacterized protein n=1 Tax=Hypothenemus hampei TaxID=57062 RepID=A0ABD1E2Z4_HYPHA
MENFFYKIDELTTKLHLFKKSKNILNDKVNLQDSVKWIRVSNFGQYHYKTSLDRNTPFHEVDLNKKGARKIEAGEVVLSKLPKCNSLSIEKISNLKDQLKFVHEDYR